MSTQKQHHSFSYYKSTEEFCERCAVPCCEESGKHKVLLDPKNPQEGVYMCLDHVKEHNRAINYFKNMGTQEIEAELKADTIWRLPTWPLRGDHKRFIIGKNFFNLFEEGGSQSCHVDRELIFPPEVEEAAKIINVSLPIALSDLKKIYKAKVKQLHPDLNRTKKGTEEELKKINIAYKTLSTYLRDA